MLKRSPKLFYQNSRVWSHYIFSRLRSTLPSRHQHSVSSSETFKVDNNNDFFITSASASASPSVTSYRHRSRNRNHPVDSNPMDSNTDDYRQQKYRQASLTETIIANTLDRIEELIYPHNTPTANEDNKNIKSLIVINQSYIHNNEELYNINSKSYSNYLLRSSLVLPFELVKRISNTYDSHLRLQILTNFKPTITKIRPDNYLKLYMRIRYNVSEPQLRKLLKCLLFNKYYENACIILLENRLTMLKTFDIVIDDVYGYLKEINDLEIGFDNFLFKFHDHSITSLRKQLLNELAFKIYNESNKRALFVKSMLINMKAGSFLDNTYLRNDEDNNTPLLIQRYRDIEDLNEEMQRSVMEIYDSALVSLPISIKLKMLDIQLKFLQQLYLQDLNLNQFFCKSRDLIVSHLANDEDFIKTPGVLSRILTNLYPINSKENYSNEDVKIYNKNLDEFFIKLLNNFKFKLNEHDFIFLGKLLYSNKDSLYLWDLYSKNVGNCELKDNEIIEIIVNNIMKYKKLFKSEDNVRQLMQFIENKKISSDVMANCLYYLFKNEHGQTQVSFFKESYLKLKDPEYINKVLKKLSFNICLDFIKDKQNPYGICFKKIINLIRVINQNPYYNKEKYLFLKEIIDEILTDDEFILKEKYKIDLKYNKNCFEANFIRFSKLKYINLYYLNYINYQIMNKKIINLDFNLNLFQRILIQDLDYQFRNLKTFGKNLSLLEFEKLLIFLNYIISNIEKELINDKIEQFQNLIQQIIFNKLEKIENITDFNFKQFFSFLNNLNFENQDIHKLIISKSEIYLMKKYTQWSSDKALIFFQKNNYSNSLMRGYLLGILQSNNIPDFEKIKILHNMISKEVHLQRKTTIGSQIIITFVNSILESLDDNNFSTLNTTDQLIWGINQYLQKFTPQISQVNENTCTSSSSSSSIDKVLTTTAIILNSTLENNNNSSFPEKWNEKLLELKRNEKGFWSIEYQMMKEKKKEKKKI